MRTAAFKDELEFCSNFYPVPHGIMYDGKVYPSVEHAYVAAKVAPELRATTKGWDTLETLPPGKVKALGRKFKLRDDWNDVRLTVMEGFLQQKFAKSPLKEMLLNTKDMYLEETNWWKDHFWGVCNGVGENHLGRLLMKVRHEIGGPVPHVVTPKLKGPTFQAEMEF